MFAIESTELINFFNEKTATPKLQFQTSPTLAAPFSFLSQKEMKENWGGLRSENADVFKARSECESGVFSAEK